MYDVLIDELVITEDFESIDNADRQRILKAIRKKLSIEPEKYGERLKGDLTGLWKLKVGKYRVVYEIQKEKVLVYVIKVGFRRDYEVYKELAKRVGEIKK
ncbi:MAG: type II toxin-antitoxin system RelE/ParE family toxin [Thermodesulfobacteriota bacterium]